MPALPERWKKWIPSPVTVILIAFVAYFWLRPPAKVAEENRVIPPFQVQLVNGGELTSQDLKGKVVLVNYWATWCPYCQMEMPEIEKFWQAYRSRGFAVVAISADDSPEKIRTWFAQHGYDFPAAPDNASTRRAFGYVSVLPTSFILDREGHLRHTVEGRLYYGRLKDLVLPLLRQAPAKD